MPATRPLSARLDHVDTLRVLLICLVIAHHAAQPYGPTGGAWPVAPDGSSPWLGPFFSGNAAFFMGLFFLLSGLFVSSAVDRKGPVRFLGQRALRLGVPLLIVGGPVFGFIDYAGSGSEAPFIAYLFDTYLAGDRIEIAHMWFVAHLLVYSAVYVLWRTLRPSPPSPLRPPPSNRAVLGLLLAIGILATVVQGFYRQDEWIKAIPFLPIEPVHLPQYVAMFGVGILAGRNGWLRKLPLAQGLLWLRIGLAALVLLYAWVSAIQLGRLTESDGIVMLGNAVWRFWEATICVGLCIGLPVLMRDRLQGMVRRVAPWGRAVYGTYILHVFVVVGIQTLLLEVSWPPLVKFGAATLLCIVVTFPVARLLSAIPGINRVL